MESELPDLTPFAEWLKINKISRSSGYRLVRDDAVKIVKIRRRSYITRSERERFVKSLPVIGGDHAPA